MKKWISRIFWSIILFLLLGVFILYQKQNRLIFAATQLVPTYEFNFDTPFEEVNITTPDQVNIHGIHFKVPNPKGVILYFHGNAGDLSRWGYIASYFTKLEYDILVVDYRTYGKSTGSIDEQKMLTDTQLWYDYVLKSYKEEDLIVYGRSIGTAFASYVASKNTPRKLILETPFYNLLDMVEQRFGAIPGIEKILKVKLESNHYIAGITVPVVIYHGTADRVVGYASGKKLSALIPKDKLTFITLNGGNHHNLRSFQRYQNTIEKSLQ
jgi:pimeloyl-ACP methyl ester carboxylesterase